jgi:hypothetical protein
MILRILKSNRAVNLILFPLIGIIFWLKSLLAPYAYPFYLGENKGILFSPISKITDGQLLIKVVISLVLVIFIGFLIQQVNDRFGFIRVRTKLPASVYVIIVGGFISLHTLHPVYFAALFLLLAIHSFFSVFNNPEPFGSILKTGLSLGIGSLFYFNLFIVLPAFLIGIVVLSREIHWREFVILIIGFIIPFIFAFGYAFYTDQLLELLYNFERNVVTPVNHFKSDIILQLFLLLLLLFTVTASIILLQQYDTRKISTRKYYSIFLIVFVFTMISFAFIPATSVEILVISAVPLTFLISNFFISIQSGFWSELLFTLLFAFVIFIQIAEILF